MFLLIECFDFYKSAHMKKKTCLQCKIKDVIVVVIYLAQLIMINTYLVRVSSDEVYIVPPTSM